jgi:hypothetical protein
MDRELPHDGLAGAGGRAHQHAVPVLQRLARGNLEGIQPKVQATGEFVEGR